MNREALLHLASGAAVRKQAHRMLELALEGKTAFEVHLEKLPQVVTLVLDETRRNYPDGSIPFHSRWEHFKAGGVDRVALLDQRLKRLSPVDRARAKLDLAIVSVLLDAGSGPEWKYRSAEGAVVTRSEGLAVASFDAFCAGLFGNAPLHGDGKSAFRVDASALEALTPEALGQAMQVGPGNPLVGLADRCGLLNRLGASCRAYPEYFGAHEPRPGNLIDHWRALAIDGEVSATDLLQAVLLGFQKMWPPRLTVDGVGFGDVWTHPLLAEPLPFHKLSQWMTYSLIEPVEEAGIRVTGVDQLTGLPEYRNGGLFLDLGVLAFRDPSQARRKFEVQELPILEWRALTVALLDRVGEAVRRELGKTEAELPLGRVLQGGTWSAGRRIAAELRPGGGPPLQLVTDGTVF